MSCNKGTVRSLRSKRDCCKAEGTLRAELQLLRAAMQRTKTENKQEIVQLLQSASCHQAQVSNLLPNH